MTSDPANISSITLECISLKIFTSCLRDAMYTLLKADVFIEHRIQRAFFLNYPETFEHTARMAHVINQTRIKKRSPIVTNNLSAVCNRTFHYNKYFQTPFITVGQSVLQGNCVSPLTSSLCFNTYIHFISDQKFKKVGFIHNLLSTASTGLNLQTMQPSKLVSRMKIISS